jgi:hypothetical protein
MRVNTSKLVFDNCRPGDPVFNVFEEKQKKEDDGQAKTQTQLDTSQTDYHKYNFFYPTSLLKRPEFVYPN